MRYLFHLLWIALIAISITSCGEDEKEIIGAKIIKVDLTSFPNDDNGSSWDLLDDADIYVKFDRGTSISTDGQETEDRFDNATSPGTYSWDVDWDMNFLSDTYVLAVYDYDLVDSDDEMSIVSFVPNDYKSGTPSTFTVSNSTTSFTVTVNWTREE